MPLAPDHEPDWWMWYDGFTRCRWCGKTKEEHAK